MSDDQRLNEQMDQLLNHPALVIGQNLEYGDECWASFDGEPIAVGVFKAGELHPSRVIVRPEKGA